MGEQSDKPQTGRTILAASVAVIATALASAIMQNVVDRTAPADQPLPAWVVSGLPWATVLLSTAAWAMAWFGSRAREQAWNAKAIDWMTAKKTAVTRISMLEGQIERNEETIAKALDVERDRLATDYARRLREATRKAVAMSEQAQSVVIVSSEQARRAEAEAERLRTRLTPGGPISDCIHKLSGLQEVVGTHRLTALTVLIIIRDVADSKDSETKHWMSVRGMINFCLEYSSLPISGTNADNARHPLETLLFAIPRPCVDTKRDREGGLLYAIRPFGREVIWWSHRLDVNSIPARVS